MLDALTSAAFAAPVAPGVAPDALTVVGTSDTGAALAWAPVTGVTAYRVWRAQADGGFAIAGSVAGPSFGDSGLIPRSSYRWRVSAIVDGVEGPTSADAAATTRPTPEPCDAPGTCPVRR